MYILRSELFVQTLAEGTQAKFTRRHRAGVLISSQRSSRTRKDERPSFSNVIDLVYLECEKCVTRKGKSCADVRVEYFFDFVVCDLKEWLPQAKTSVPYRDA